MLTSQTGTSGNTTGEGDKLVFTVRGYTVTVDAATDDGENWRSIVRVDKDGEVVSLPDDEVPETFWVHRAEALRAGGERARYLLERRDGLLDARNPARRDPP